jgi:hypothetical protein
VWRTRRRLALRIGGASVAQDANGQVTTPRLATLRAKQALVDEDLKKWS